MSFNRDQFVNGHDTPLADRGWRDGQRFRKPRKPTALSLNPCGELFHSGAYSTATNVVQLVFLIFLARLCGGAEAAVR